MAVFKRRSDKDAVQSSAVEPTAPSTRQSAPKGTVIGSGLTVDGRIRAKEEIRVFGKVTGNMNVRGRVVVEDGGLVTANIKAEEIVIRGKVQGDIDCDRANIEPKGELIGDVASPRMMLADGAVFKGKIDMAPKEGATVRGGKPKPPTGTKTS